ncbi:MAG: PKD domain-containing protein, partial [Nitrospiria bacterium]
GPCNVAPSNLVLDKSIFHFTCTESQNKPPIADSGSDKKIPLEKSIVLDGTKSYDPDGDSITSYQWAIDSAPVGSEELLKDSTLAKLKFVPDKAGEYLFSLKVSDGKMMSKVDTMRLSVVINLPPIGKASVSPSSGLAPLKVWFDASPSSDPEGGRLDHVWNFGDPSSGVENRSNLGIFSHVYRNSGYYTAILTVTDEHGKKSINTFEIQVKGVDLPPSVAPSGEPGNGNNPLSVQFSANASDPEGAKLSYRWDFGDGSKIATDMDPVHQYSAGGSFDIVLIVSDGTHQIKRRFSLSLRKKTAREKFSYDFFKK